MTKKVNHRVKARMFVGGLKSLFGEMHDALAEIEKTGVITEQFVDSLSEVKEGIDLAMKELKKISEPCCEYDTPHDCEEDDCDDYDDEQDNSHKKDYDQCCSNYCKGCDCYCHDEEE